MMSDALEFALQTARGAGQILRNAYQQQHTVHLKSTDIDLVTEADIASEQFIVPAIRQRFPEHRILSEEGLGDLEVLADGAEWLWLVDPLDGTINYAHGYPCWAVSLALACGGEVVLGVSYDPLRDEMFWAEKGTGAWCNGARIQVSGVDRLAGALVATGFAYKRAIIASNNLAEFGQVMPRVQGIRRGGSAVIDLAYVACGRLDGYWEMNLNPWDWAAGWLLVTEAGGRVSDLQGEGWRLDTGNVVASNGSLHPALLAALRKPG